MNDNKVSEKAIWEGTITPDNDTPSLASQMQTQPQMMFCYKCNNVIPGDSNFCPYCQIELYVTCPKCGLKYSSQYPSCSQCGTNREEYIELQRMEQERIDAKKQEESKLRRENERRLKEAKEVYKTENENIIKTEEFQILYSLLSDSLSRFRTRRKIGKVLMIIACILSWTLPFLLMFNCIIIKHWLWGILIVISPGATSLVLDNMLDNDDVERKKRKKFVVRYMRRKVGYDKDLFDYVRNQDPDEVGPRRFCINVYRKKKGLQIHDSWDYFKCGYY